MTTTTVRHLEILKSAEVFNHEGIPKEHGVDLQAFGLWRYPVAQHHVLLITTTHTCLWVSDNEQRHWDAFDCCEHSRTDFPPVTFEYYD